MLRELKNGTQHASDIVLRRNMFGDSFDLSLGVSQLSEVGLISWRWNAVKC